MGIAQDYTKAKADFDSAWGRARTAVKRVLRAYAEQKDTVSTGRAVSWSRMQIGTFRFSDKSIQIELIGSGRYGYTHHTHLKLPVAWLEMGDAELRAAVKERMVREAEGFSQRAEKRLREQEQRIEEAERAKLAELLAKYPEVAEGQ